MQVEVVRPRELGAPELQRWRDLQAAAPALQHAFLAPGFAMAVDRVRSDTRVAVLRQGSAIVGFLGFQHSADGRALPLGAGLADVSGPVLDAGAQVVPGEVVRACGLRRWSFDHLLSVDPAWSRWQHSATDAPVLDLSAGPQAYSDAVRARSSSVLTTAARKRRGLVRDLGPVHLVEEPDGACLPLLRRWKSAQYDRTGQWDRFAVPWIVALLDELVQARDPDCRASLVVLRAGERVVAAHFGLRSSLRLAWWFPAYDAELGRHSPGTTMLLDLVPLAAELGVQAIDLGRGEEEYKRRVSNSALAVAQGWVPASTGATAAWHARQLALTARSRTPASVKSTVRRGARALHAARSRS